jgi:aprataxin
MKMTAEEIAQFLKPNKIRIGFHAIPSLDGLHLHIISEDMAFCKHKKHYNSFMTDFLVKPETVIELLRQGK